MQRWVVIALLAATGGCNTGLHRGIIYSSSVDPNVRNGTAYDTAELDAGDYETVVIPTRAKVRSAGDSDTLRIEMVKSMQFAGHPPDWHSIDDVRQRMGCAWRSEGQRLYLATFGEFDSGIEGGQRLDLTLVIPDSLEVERDDAHEMSRESDGKAHASLLRKQDEGDRAHYATVDSDERWTPLADRPDPRRAAASQ